MLRLLAPRNHV